MKFHRWTEPRDQDRIAQVIAEEAYDAYATGSIVNFAAEWCQYRDEVSAINRRFGVRS